MKTLIFILVFLGVASYGQVLHVPGQYATIQKGVDAAQPGDTSYGSALNVNLNHSGIFNGEGNIFKDNVAITGGAVFITNGVTSLVNNVFTQNSASESGFWLCLACIL